MSGLHHIHLRKRLYKLAEPYPHPARLKRWLDKVMVVVAIAGPLSTIPQVVQLYTTKDAEGLSFVTWFLWTVLSVLWGLYGYVHKETPIVISNVMYVLLQGLVVVGIFLYR